MEILYFITEPNSFYGPQILDSILRFCRKTSAWQVLILQVFMHAACMENQSSIIKNHFNNDMHLTLVKRTAKYAIHMQNTPNTKIHG